MIEIDGLTTENVNEATKHIDQMDSLGIVTLINQEDKKVADAVEKELPVVAKAVDAIAARFGAGGRIIRTHGNSGFCRTSANVQRHPRPGAEPVSRW
jgi:N-acetylmuramic acid 6-phosphate etherase